MEISSRGNILLIAKFKAGFWRGGVHPGDDFAPFLELCTGAGVPELRYILPELEPELENSSKNSGRQNYEKLMLM